MTTETDRVLVRIWFKDNNQTTEAHISVQTTNLFFSVWPEEYLSNFKLSNLSSQSISYEEDCALENNHEPDKIFSFYSLDEKILEENYNIMKDHSEYIKKTRENLLVAKLSERRDEYGDDKSSPQDCVWRILMMRGADVDDIREPSRQSFWKMDYVEDFDLKNFLKELNSAKVCELKKHPETRGFDQNIGITTPKTEKICMVM